jgi:hypothetical protein
MLYRVIWVVGSILPLGFVLLFRALRLLGIILLFVVVYLLPSVLTFWGGWCVRRLVKTRLSGWGRMFLDDSGGRARTLILLLQLGKCHLLIRDDLAQRGSCTLSWSEVRNFSW